MPLVVKLSTIGVMTVNTCRQRGGKRIVCAPRTRGEPTGRRGFELFAISSNRSQQRAAQRTSSPRATAKGQADTKTRALDVVQRRRGSRQVHWQARDVRERRPRAANIEVLLLIRSSSSERVVDDLADNKSSR